MKQFKKTLLIIVCSLSLTGCELTEYDKMVLESAQSAFLRGDFVGAAQTLYWLGKSKMNSPQNGQQDEQTGVFSELMFKQSSQAIQLASCIVFDMLNLVEQNFGQPGRDFRQEMLRILKELEKLNPLPQDAPDPNLQQANFMAEQYARNLSKVKDCRELNQEYNQFKRELGHFLEPLGLPEGSQNDYYSSTERAFNYTYLRNQAAEYYEVAKKLPKRQEGFQPLD